MKTAGHEARPSFFSERPARHLVTDYGPSVFALPLPPEAQSLFPLAREVEQELEDVHEVQIE
ncbi:hypothetical protein ACVJBD_007107 [Rhizobium mongolense]